MNESLKDILKVRFQPNRDTLISFILGFSVVIASVVLVIFIGEKSLVNEISIFIVRDLVQVFILGFAVPMYYTVLIKRQGFERLGITKEKWKLSIALNGLFTFLLALQYAFLSDEDGKVLLSPKAISPIMYIMVVGIFEILFFYGFLRENFEEAFGIIPSILLSAIFYSFHHAGFQPEFVKLFFVGIMYASAFRITKNILIIYPFFWGLGATWDVLVSFGAIDLLADAWIYALIIVALMGSFTIYIVKKSEKISNMRKEGI